MGVLSSCPNITAESCVGEMLVGITTVRVLSKIR